MAEHNNIGKSGEQQAVNYLCANGYEVLTRNYRFKRFEIDIIAKLDLQVIFIEVKSRSSEYFGKPEEFVSEAQQKRISSAANQWVDDHEWEGEVRFDIIALSKKSGLNHIQDAFYLINNLE